MLFYRLQCSSCLRLRSLAKKDRLKCRSKVLRLSAERIVSAGPRFPHGPAWRWTRCFDRVQVFELGSSPPTRLALRPAPGEPGGIMNGENPGGMPAGGAFDAVL
jgi:hypothetical protein